MKKLLSLLLLPLLLNGCGSSDEFVHSSEPRSNVYVGQSAGDIYENFGRPTRVISYSNDTKELIYEWQEMEKDWAYRYLRSCKMQFFVKDNRLMSWTADGDMCMISSGGAKRYTKDGVMSFKEEQGLFDGWFDSDDEFEDAFLDPFDPMGASTPVTTQGQSTPQFDEVANEFPGYQPSPRQIQTHTITGVSAGYNLPDDAFM